MFLIRLARAAHLPDIVQLLERASLVSEGIETLLGQLYVGELESRPIACGAFEYYPPLALLRSVAVDPQFQKQGFGSRLVAHLLEQLQILDVEKVYLLTVTAESFFHFKFQFRPISREEVPSAVKKSPEFSYLQCTSATCMVKDLKGE